jgi:hypothetical protein
LVYVLSRPEGDVEVFFVASGKHGQALWSPFWAEAAKFHDARAAYECAATHRDLRQSDRWRATEITERCTRTK